MFIARNIQVRPDPSVPFFGEAHPTIAQAYQDFIAGQALVLGHSTTRSLDGLSSVTELRYASYEDMQAVQASTPPELLIAFRDMRVAYNEQVGIELRREYETVEG